MRLYLRLALARCPRLQPHAVELERQVRALAGRQPRPGTALARIVQEVCGEHLGRELEEMGRRA